MERCAVKSSQWSAAPTEGADARDDAMVISCPCGLSIPFESGTGDALQQAVFALDALHSSFAKRTSYVDEPDSAAINFRVVRELWASTFAAIVPSGGLKNAQLFADTAADEFNARFDPPAYAARMAQLKAQQEAEALEEREAAAYIEQQRGISRGDA